MRLSHGSTGKSVTRKLEVGHRKFEIRNTMRNIRIQDFEIISYFELVPLGTLRRCFGFVDYFQVLAEPQKHYIMVVIATFGGSQGKAPHCGVLRFL